MDVRTPHPFVVLASTRTTPPRRMQSAWGMVDAKVDSFGPVPQAAAAVATCPTPQEVLPAGTVRLAAIQSAVKTTALVVNV